MSSIDLADVKLVRAQTGCSEEEAIEVLGKHKNDLLGALLDVVGGRYINKKVNDPDIKLICSQTGATKEEATVAYDKHKGDILFAILEILEIMEPRGKYGSGASVSEASVSVASNSVASVSGVIANEVKGDAENTNYVETMMIVLKVRKDKYEEFMKLVEENKHMFIEPNDNDLGL